MASSTFVMVLDNVIRKPGTEALNVQGLHLYNGFIATGRLAILCGEDREKAEWFLKTNGLTKHAYLIPERPDSSPTNSGRRLAQITELRAQNAHIEFLVEPDPEIAAEVFKQGIPTLLYSHPQYSQPSFRPDYRSTAKPWENLVNEVEYQITMRANALPDDKDDE